jgi:hypothetical protein
VSNHRVEAGRAGTASSAAAFALEFLEF